MRFILTLEKFTKQYQQKIDVKDFKKIKKGSKILYMGGQVEVLDNNGYVLKLKGENGKTFTVNKSQFDHGGMIKEGVLDNIHLMADASKDYEDFKKKFKKGFPKIFKSTPDFMDWLYGMYKDMAPDKVEEVNDGKKKKKKKEFHPDMMYEGIVKDLKKIGDEINYLVDADDDTKKIWKKAGFDTDDDDNVILYSYVASSWPETKKLLDKKRVKYKELEDPNSAGESFIVFKESVVTEGKLKISGAAYDLWDEKEVQRKLRGVKIKIVGDIGGVATIKGDDKELQKVKDILGLEESVQINEGIDFQAILLKDAMLKYNIKPTGGIPRTLQFAGKGYMKAPKGTFLIGLPGGLFAVNMKKKFAVQLTSGSRAYLDAQDKLKDNEVGGTNMAPEYSKWRQYLKESVNESMIGITTDKSFKPADLQKALDKAKIKGYKMDRLSMTLTALKLDKKYFNDAKKLIDDLGLSVMMAKESVNEAKDQWKEEREYIKQMADDDKSSVYKMADYVQFLGLMTQRQWEKFMYGMYKKDLQKTDTKTKNKIYKVFTKMFEGNLFELSSQQDGTKDSNGKHKHEDHIEEDIEAMWKKTYGEDFVKHYPAIVKIIRQRKIKDKREIARIWQDTYGEDFEKEYPALYNKL